jgi:hypothetical protein
MKKLTTYGNIVNGTLKIAKREQFYQSIAQAKDCKIKLTVEKIYNKRSNKQNNYYFGVIIDCYLDCVNEAEGRPLGIEFLNKATGEIIYIPLSKQEAKQTVHEMFKTLFNESESTTTNSTTKQEIYHEFCRDYIKGCYGYTVPLPNEQLELTNFTQNEK